MAVKLTCDSLTKTPCQSTRLPEPPLCKVLGSSQQRQACLSKDALHTLSNRDQQPSIVFNAPSASKARKLRWYTYGHTLLCRFEDMQHGTRSTQTRSGAVPGRSPGREQQLAQLQPGLLHQSAAWLYALVITRSSLSRMCRTRSTHCNGTHQRAHHPSNGQTVALLHHGLCSAESGTTESTCPFHNKQ
jgi:hypothetical protein